MEVGLRDYVHRGFQLAFPSRLKVGKVIGGRLAVGLWRSLAFPTWLGGYNLRLPDASVSGAYDKNKAGKCLVVGQVFERDAYHLPRSRDIVFDNRDLREGISVAGDRPCESCEEDRHEEWRLLAPERPPESGPEHADTPIYHEP